MKTVLIHQNENSTETSIADVAVSAASQSTSYAARLGRWSATHWKTATFGWLALVLVAFAVGGQVGTKQAA